MPSKEQTAIIEAPADRHIKVVAVAGSGKSSTIRQRVAHLIRECGIDPRRMLILMFNKSAQIEFATKLGALNVPGPPPSTRTYHSMGSRLCQSLTERGFLARADLVDDAGKRRSGALARHALAEVVGDTKIRGLKADNRGAQSEFLEFVDLVKSSSVGPEASFKEAGIDQQFEPWVECFYAFERARKKASIRFFSDLIYDPVMMLLSNPEAQSFISNKMQQILVDEYQDINDISQELIRLIAGQTAKVTVVGDDDQTIYEFRGSRPHYLINRFEESFPDPLTFKLSRTYRYGHSISLIANNVIRRNTDRFTKVCISDASTKPALIKLFQARHGGGSLSEALETVVTPILDYQSKGLRYSDCAVLLRLFASAPVIELALMLRRVPYSLEGARPVLQQEPFKTFLAMISVCAAHTPDCVADTVHALLPHSLAFPPMAMKRDKIELLMKLVRTRALDKEAFLDELGEGLSNAARTRLLDRLIAIEWISKNLSLPPAEFMAGFLEKSNAREIIRMFAGDDDEGAEELRAIDAFLAFLRELNCKSHAELEQFIEQYQAICDTSTSSVRITTVHRSKGLEWPVVVIPRLCETLFPHERKNQPTDMQSERRLFYVAVTRATRYLVLVVPSDDLLERSIAERRSEIPLSIFGDNARASRFVYEANIAPSVVLAKDIHNRADYSAIEELDDPEPFNEYLRAIGSEMTISPARVFRT